MQFLSLFFLVVNVKQIYISPSSLPFFIHTYVAIAYGMFLQVCVTAGLCMSADFTFYSTAQAEKQEQWDDRCFVCQAVAKDIEVCAAKVCMYVCMYVCTY